MQGKRLTKHVIRSVGVESASSCEIECFLEEFCVSYNLGPFQHGRHVCELSNSDAIRHPVDLVPDPAYNYRESVVSTLQLMPVENERKSTYVSVEISHCEDSNVPQFISAVYFSSIFLLMAVSHILLISKLIYEYIHRNTASIL